MRKINLTTLFISLILNVTGQIVFENTYSVSSNGAPIISNFFLIKLNNGGYKYVIDDHNSKILKLYNTNHSLFISISLPPTFSNVSVYNINYVSDNLFDLNNDIEYIITTGGTGVNSKTYVMKDNGSMMFQRDSSIVYYGGTYGDNVLENTTGIFQTSTGVKMKLSKYSTSTSLPNKWEIYSLPGVIPCVQCTTATMTNFLEYTEGGIEPLFYPNPASDLLKLRYELPKQYKKAVIKVMDLQGRLIEEFEVTNDFNSIYLPKEFNTGLYLYSLTVDGKVIKTEKIILSR